MKITIELTPDQVEEIASAVARKVGFHRTDPYTPHELADKLGVSLSTVRRRIAAKVYPVIPNLGNVRIPADFVSRLLSSSQA